MQRFFVSPDRLKAGRVTFSPEQSHQITRVLRLTEGDSVVVLDNAGWMYDVSLTELSPVATVGAIRRRHLAAGEPRTKVTLYPALLRSDKLEIVFQKCTELGVSAFAPIVTDRCTVGATVSDEKQRRWERIIGEAAEQSERGRMPQLLPISLFPQSCEQVRGLSLIACERGDRRSLREEVVARIGERSGHRPFAVNLFVGPEGGFSEAEIERARGYGIVPVGLGPRILRAETAAIVGATLLFAYAGDLE